MDTWLVLSQNKSYFVLIFASSNVSYVSLTDNKKETTWTKVVVVEQRQGAESQEDLLPFFLFL